MPTIAETTAKAADYWNGRREMLGKVYVASGFRTAAYDQELNEVGLMLDRAIPPDSRVLDFGCGLGRFRPAIEATGSSYDGIEVIPGLSTIEWDLENLPRGYDVVVAAFVLQHISDEDAYLHWVKQLHRCLNYGGRLIVVEEEPFESRNADTEFLTPRGMLGVLDPEPWKGAKNVPVQLGGHWFGVFLKKALEMPQGDAPVFRMDDDGKLWAETIPMPEKIAISANLLEDPSRMYATRDGELITMNLANGRWVYRIVGWYDEVTAIAELETAEVFE